MGSKKWIHGVSSIYTSAIHYVSDTPRVSSGYPMYPVYPYVSLCITPCILNICLNSKTRLATKFVISTKPTFVSYYVNDLIVLRRLINKSNEFHLIWSNWLTSHAYLGILWPHGCTLLAGLGACRCAKRNCSYVCSHC